MNIECPSCAKENKIEYGENIFCHECKSSFSGYTYRKFEKPFVTAVTALFIGIVGTYNIEQRFFDEGEQRYPVKVEYEIIDTCLNSDKRALTSSKYIQKKELCSCALGLTMDLLSYEEATDNKDRFLEKFRLSAEQCK